LPFIIHFIIYYLFQSFIYLIGSFVDPAKVAGLQKYGWVGQSSLK